MHGIGTSVVAAIGVLVGIAVTVFVSWLVMAKSEAIDKRLGEGRAVVTRLMGLIVMAIAVQFIINGIMDVTPEFVKIVDEAGIPMILVGDSAAMVVHGLSGTVPMTMDQMVQHC